MFRSLSAILVGYLVMAISTAVCLTWLDQYIAENFQAIDMRSAPPTDAILANLIFSTLCAIAGGMATSVVAGHNPMQHGLVFAAIVFVFGILYGIQMRNGPQPRWYLLVLPICGTAGVIAGAWLHSSVAQRLKRRLT